MRLTLKGATWVGAIVLACVAGCGDDQSAEDSSSSGSGSTGGVAETTDPSTTSAETGEETGEETGGSETGEEVVCDDLSVGSTPLRRLTRAQYANAIRDALGLVAEVDALDSDEKAGPFDSNYSASVSPDARRTVSGGGRVACD